MSSQNVPQNKNLSLVVLVYMLICSLVQNQLIANGSPILNTDNTLKFDKIDKCENYLELLNIFVQENPQSLIDTILQPYIKCSSPSFQDISNQECCQNIENAQFSLIEWTNFLHGHDDLEFLYAPTLLQGVCHPSVCNANELEKNKDFIVEMIKLSGYDKIIMGGVEKVVIPGIASNSTGNSTENQAGNNTLDFKIFGDDFVPFNFRSTEQNRNIDDHITLFIIFIILFSMPFVLCLINNVIKKDQKTFLHAFDYKIHIKNFIPNQKSMRKGPLDIFNVLRVIGVMLVVLIHQFQNQSLASNYHEVAKESHSPFILLIYFSFEAVDMFLFMGGFFQAISMLPEKKLQKMSEGKLFGFLNVLKSTFYRFLRVWPALLVNVLIFTQIYYYLGFGPLWNMQEGEIESCDDFMYSNLLFIDNLSSEYTWKCFGHSWYLSVDFQLYIFCTLAIFVASKHRLTGNIILWVTLIGCFIYNAVFLIQKEILALDIADIAKFEQFTEATTYYEVGMNFYRKPWARAPVFIIGLLFGKSYVNKEFAFGQKFSDFMKKYTLIQKLGLILSFGIIVLMIYFPLPLLSDPTAYSTGVQSIYFLVLPILTMTSIMMFVSIIIVMYNNSENSQKLVNFVSSRFIAVFAKVSFMMYLTHLMIIKYRLFSQTQLLPWTIESMLGQYIFNFLISILIATFLHIYIECPMGALTVWIQQTTPIQKPLQQSQQKPIQVDIEQNKKMQNSNKIHHSPKNVITEELVIVIESNQNIVVNSQEEQSNSSENNNNNHQQQQQNTLQNEQQQIQEKNQIQTETVQQKQQQQNKNLTLKQQISKHFFAILLICIISASLLPLLFANNDVSTEIQNQNYLSYTVSSDGEIQTQISFQNTEKICFPNCKSCFGSNFNQCNECLPPFELHAQKSTCLYPEALRSENSIEFEKQTLYSNTNKKTLRILKNQVQCPVNNKTPEYYIKLGKLAQKWVINFSSLEKWQNNEGDLPNTLPTQKGFFKIDQIQNPSFYEYNYLTILDCFGSEQQENKEQIVEDILQEVGQKFDFKIARSVIIVSDDTQGYDLALEFASENKLKNIITNLFNVELDLYLILDGVSATKNNNNLIKKLEIPTFFLVGDGYLSQYNSVCLEKTQTEEEEQQMQIFQQNKETIIQKSKQSGNNLWNPSCYLDTQQYLNKEAFHRVQINSIPVSTFLYEWSQYNKNFKKNQQLEFKPEKPPVLETKNDCKDLFKAEKNMFCYQEVYISQIRTDFDENFQTETEEYNKEQWDTFETYQLKEEMGAKCANGIPPSTHFRQGIKKQRWLIHMKGNGWALDWDNRTINEDLQGRYKFAEKYTSTKKWSYPNFSRTPFYDYNRADIIYCDPGSMRQGYSEEPIEIDGKQFWFRGHNNTIAQFDTLIQNFDLANSKEVVLFGASSGGPSATIYVNILQEMLHKINPYVKVKLITEGGMFLDAKNGYSEEMTFRNSFLNGFYQFANKDESFPPNKDCVSDQIPGEEWKCLFQQYAQKYVDSKIPTLLINSGYDFSQVNRVKKIYCYGYTADQGGQKIDFFNIQAGCDDNDMVIIESYRTELYKQLNIMKTFQSQLSVWVPSCSSHNFLNYQMNPNWQVPQDSGNTLYKITKEFLEDDKVAFQLDDVAYPLNTGCANTSP